MTASTQPSRFALEALVLAALLLGLQGLTVVLQTDGGRGLFVEEDFGQDLTRRAGGGLQPSEEGLLLDPGQSASRGLVKLRPMTLEVGRTYLIVTTAGAGGHLTFEGTEELSGQRIFHRLRQREVRSDYQFGLTLDDESGSPERELVLWMRNHGAAPLEVPRLELHRLGRAHGLLLAIVPWAVLLLTSGFVWHHRRRLLGALRIPSTAEDAFFAAAVFLVFLGLFRMAPVDQVMDSRYTTTVSRSLIRTGSLALPGDEEPGRYGRLPYQLQRVGSDVHHYYPAAPAILNAPVVAAYMALGISPVDERGQYLPVVEMRILAILAALQAAALCAVLYLLARRFVDPRFSLALVTVFALGTQIFSTISRSYWTHAWATLLLSLGLLLATSARVRDSRLGMAALATVLSWGFFCRPTLALAILGISAVLFHSHRNSRLGWYAATGASWAALFVARSMALFGTVLPPYFAGNNHTGEPLSKISPNLPSYTESALGALISPSRGLFVFVPLFLWILFMVVAHWRHLERRGLVVCGLAVFVGHWQILAYTGLWRGGLAFGPRLLSDIVPWFFLFAALVLQSLASSHRGRNFLMSAWQPALLTIVVMFSIFVNSRGAFSQDTVRWNPREVTRAITDPNSELKPSGIWSWRYPQFLAGLQDPPKPPSE